MQTTDYQTLKNQFLLQPIGYREVAKNEIVALDEAHFQIGKAVLSFSQKISADIDRFIGIKAKQSKLAERAYGANGITNLRNFFSQASQNNDERVILVADLNNRKVNKIFRTQNHLIPPESFFDFAEMFMDKNRYEPESVEFDFSGTEVSIRMKSLNPQVMSFAKDDDFISNGLWLRWNPSEVAFGNYYERLVCSNGMTQMSQNRLMRADSLTDKNMVDALLAINGETPALRQNLALMLSNAKTAIHTRASVYEMGIGARMLQHFGVDKYDAEKLIPYEENRTCYEQSGYPVNTAGLQQAISSMTVWQLFNILTSFATHTPTWIHNDLRRPQLMERSVSLLNSKRNIIEYNNVFG